MRLFSRRRLAAAVVFVAVMAAVPGAAVAAPVKHYRIVDLGTLGGNLSDAFAVNDRGQVVGMSQTVTQHFHAFLWSDGVMTDLGVLESPPNGGESSIAVDVNNRGQVVGSSNVANGTASHAFLWERGVMTDLGTLGGRYSTASAINDRGQIVGDSETASGTWEAFLWERGEMRPLGIEEAADINDRGESAGRTGPTGYLVKRSGLVDLGEMWQPVAVNNRGWVAGYGPSLTGYLQSHVWRDGVTTLLGWPRGYSQVQAMNDHGDAVGMGAEVLFDPLHPFLWRDGVMVDLTTRGLPVDSGLRDINNKGQMAGSILVLSGSIWHAALFL